MTSNTKYQVFTCKNCFQDYHIKSKCWRKKNIFTGHIFNHSLLIDSFLLLFHLRFSFRRAGSMLKKQSISSATFFWWILLPLLEVLQNHNNLNLGFVGLKLIFQEKTIFYKYWIILMKPILACRIHIVLGEIRHFY